MRRTLTRTLAIAASAACALVAAPGCGGTNTGNPAFDVPAGNAATETYAAGILSTICAKLTACYSSLSTSQCDTGVLAQTNIAPALGLASGFGTFQSVLDAESAGTIAPTASAYSQCVSDIEALSCSSTEVQTAYSAGSPGDFSSVVNLLPASTASCKGLY